jgi:arylsulfatase A-like enzyme
MDEPVEAESIGKMLPRTLWPWLIGSLIFASIDVLLWLARFHFGNFNASFVDPARILEALFFIPAFSLLLGILCSLLLYTVRSRNSVSILALNHAPAVSGVIFLSLSLTVLFALFIHESDFFHGMVRPEWSRIVALLIVCILLIISASFYLMRTQRKGKFFISFIVLSTGLFAFLELVITLRDSPSIILRSTRGVLIVSSSAVLTFFLCLFLQRIMAALSEKPAIRKVPGGLKLVVGLTGIIAVEIFLSMATTAWRDPSRVIGGNSSRLPDIVLVVLDTVRADRLSCYGNSIEMTPNIDRLAEAGVVFENAISTAPWSIPSHASLFTGCYPLTHGATWGYPYLDEDLVTLAGFLSDIGYSTLGLSNNPNVGISTGLSRGFHNFVEVWRRNVKYPSLFLRIQFWVTELLGMEDDSARDEGAGDTNEIVRLVLRRGLGSPFFLFVNYMEAHMKYDPPHPFDEMYAGRGERVTRMKNLDFMFLFEMLAGKARLQPMDRETLIGLYNGEIAYLDYRVGELTEDLKVHDSFENTLIILTSDHGENLGDHGLLDHQFSVNETLLRLPLIIHFPPALPMGLKIATPVQSVDLFPTILALLSDLNGMDSSGHTKNLIGSVGRQMQGMSLIDVIDGNAGRDPAYSEYYFPANIIEEFSRLYPDVSTAHLEMDLLALRVGDSKLIRRSDGVRMLFDLGEDPGEEVNLAEAMPSVADSLDETLDRWRSLLPRKVLGEEPLEIDKEARDALRERGYVF